MTTAHSADKMLGIGIYTVAEAAALARLHPATLSRWLGMSPKAECVLRPELPNEKCVTFLDYVQALFVRHIRQSFKISLQRVRDAVNKATDEYKIEYPLAHQHLTYAHGKDLYIKIGTDNDATFIGATRGI